MVLVWPVAVDVVLLDCHVSRQAGHRPPCHERGAWQQASSMGQWKTLGLAAVWTIAGVITTAPGPALGLAMWLGLLIAPLLIPMEQDQIVDRLKWMLAVYTAAVIGFVMLMCSELSPRAVSAWSRGPAATGRRAGPGDSGVRQHRAVRGSDAVGDRPPDVLCLHRPPVCCSEQDQGDALGHGGGAHRAPAPSGRWA